MFIDYLQCEQTFDYDMPILADEMRITVDTLTGEQKRTSQPIIHHRGSFDTKIDIILTSNRIKMSGNASRYNRPDNLVGFSNIDDHFDIYNEILRDNNLPEFTKCTGIYHRQGEDGTKVQTFSDGALISRIDLTTNICVGMGMERDFIRALSTMRYKQNQIGHLWPDGNTTDYRVNGKTSTREYCKFYAKHPEMLVHLLRKTKRHFGVESPEYKYAELLAENVKEQGVVRAEQSLKTSLLRENRLRYWGLFNHSDLLAQHEPFLGLYQKAGGVHMDIEHISDKLLRKGIVSSTYSANVTASYVDRWKHGMTFDFTKSQPKMHAARLNKIGIDIRNPYDASRHSSVLIKNLKTIEVRPLVIPDFYQRPNNLKLVA